MNVLTNLKKNYLSLLVLLLSFIFFFGVGEYSVHLGNDSSGYINMSSLREPFYPLFLAFFRIIFGTDIYLSFVIFVQSFLGVISVSCLVLFLRRTFHLPLIVTLLFELLAFIPYGLDSLWDAPRYLYSTRIYTEGITYSIFYFYIILLLKALWSKSAVSYWGGAICAILLALTRGQMRITVIMCMFVGIYLFFLQKEKRIFWTIHTIGFLLVALLSTSAVPKLYSYFIYGHVSSPEFTMVTFMGNTLYNCTNKDILLLKTDEQKEIFSTVIQELESKNFTTISHTPGIFLSSKNISECHDKIKIHSYQPLLSEYYNAHGYTDEITNYEKQEEISSELLKILFPVHFSEWLYNCISLMLAGFLRSVFIEYWPLINFCYGYTIFIYLLALCLIYKNFKHNSESKSAIFMVAVLLLSCMNITLCSATIYCIWRYVLYTFGLFYMAGILLLLEYNNNRRSLNSIGVTEDDKK